MKNSLQTAVESFVAARSENSPWALLFCLSLSVYYERVEHGQMMVRCWVNGIRIHHDIALADVDPGYTLHTFE